MSDIQLRVPANLVEPLLSAIDSSERGERVAFGLVSHAKTTDNDLLLLRDLISAPPEAYLAPEGHGARWSGKFTLKVLNHALRKDLGVLIFHEHRNGSPVGLSADDISSGRGLVGRFAAVQPRRPHGSVVIGPTSADGLFQLGPDTMRPSRVVVRLLRDSIEDRRNGEDVPRPVSNEVFDRQILAIGNEAQGLINKAVVAVVGLCGGGSHVVQQLAHLGVGTILGIDADRAEESNRSRMIGLTEAAVRHRKLKTSALAGLVKGVGLGTRFLSVPAAIPSMNAVQALREADVVVGCVDNYHARADVQQICWRLLIPYVDVGLLIDSRLREETGQEEHWIGGNVFTLLPGSACLWCVEYLTDSKLSAETRGRERSYLRDTAAAAQVVSFNGVLASQAASEVLQLVTGFARRAPVSRMLKYNGVLGTLESWVIQPRATCPKCFQDLAAGDTLWGTADVSSQ